MTAIAALVGLCLLVLVTGRKAAAGSGLVAETFTASEAVPVYGTFEAVLTFSHTPENPFRVFRTVTFSDGKRTFKAEAFYDGGKTWRVRFMPDRKGTWTYTCAPDVKGEFTCTGREEKDRSNHGHVRRDPKHPRYLIYDDGTAHYWFGASWIPADHFDPQPGGDVKDQVYETDVQPIVIAYLDICAKLRHNGMLVKVAVTPLNDDKFTWDLKWISQRESFVREMGRRGIYCQLSFFDTWSRSRGERSKINTAGDKHVFNVWADGDEDAKENYIRTIVARFAGFYNIYWELGNEMEHAPNSGSDFVKLANSKYIPWIRKYDPYHLPIGLSEGVWRRADVDIGFLHQTGSLPSPSWKRPTIMNELVRGGIDGSMWKDTTIRNPVNRLAYRRTFWRMFTCGGCGSSQATWLRIDRPLNQAVLDVMADQRRLRDFIEALPVSINEMDTDRGFVLSGPGEFRTRRKKGSAYVTYFLLEPGESAAAGHVQLALPAGKYEITWYDPKSDKNLAESTISAEANSTRVPHPPFTEDIVLRATKAASP